MHFAIIILIAGGLWVGVQFIPDDSDKPAEPTGIRQNRRD